MSLLPNRLAASVAFHRSVQRLSKHFGGRYGQVPPKLREPRSLTLHAGDIALRMRAWDGPMPAIVLLHGLNNNAWSWARVASQLAPLRQVFALNQRGHGGSSAPPHGYTLLDTTRDLLAVLDALSLDVVDLVGHSWGGKVATHFAALHPQRVRRLVLTDPVLPKGLNRLIRSIPALSAASLRAERGPFPDRQAWEEAGRSVIYLQHWDDLDQRLWTEGFRRHDDGSYRHVLPESGFNEIMTRSIPQDIEPLLDAIACPVLLLRPTFSISFLPAETRSMHRRVPQMAAQRIAGDHSFVHTNPLDTAAALRRFLIP